jgi:hypothetical protein
MEYWETKNGGGGGELLLCPSCDVDHKQLVEISSR